MSGDRETPWNSLEIAKIIVSLTVPIAVILVGFMINMQLAAQERNWQVERLVIERRLGIYDDIREDLNRIYCFIKQVGTWKEDNPEDVIGYKRSIDQKIYSQQAFWSESTIGMYDNYMKSAFLMYSGVGQDAKIRAEIYSRHSISGWQNSWDAQLTGRPDGSHDSAYQSLMKAFANDLASQKN